MAWRRRRILKDRVGDNDGLEYLLAINETKIYMENLTKRIQSFKNETEAITGRGGMKWMKKQKKKHLLTLIRKEMGENYVWYGNAPNLYYYICIKIKLKLRRLFNLPAEAGNLQAFS